MKKALQFIFSMTILGSLMLTQMPTPGQCQMLSGSLLAKSCAMACCKTPMPAAKCPLIKAVAPNDLIATSLQNFKINLEAIHTASPDRLQALRVHPFVV